MTATVVEQFEEIANSEQENMQNAKKAASQKDWKSFCKSMKPIISKAEEFGLVVKGTAVQIYNEGRNEASEYYVKASNLAAKTCKSISENFVKVRKKCTEAVKSFWDAVKDLAVNVLKATRPLIHKITHDLHEQGKSFVEKVKEVGKNLFSSRNK